MPPTGWTGLGGGGQGGGAEPTYLDRAWHSYLSCDPSLLRSPWGLVLSGAAFFSHLLHPFYLWSSSGSGPTPPEFLLSTWLGCRGLKLGWEGRGSDMFAGILLALSVQFLILLLSNRLTI